MRVALFRPNDPYRLERWVHRTLLVGVAATGSLLLLGLVLLFARHEPRPEAPPPGLRILLRLAFSGSGLAIIDLALLILMATPVARVAVLAIGWAAEGNRRFAIVATVVLVLLGLSLVLGVG